MQWIRRRRLRGSAKPEFQEIVIFASPRSGTNFFCECLGSLPEVGGFYELFNPAGAFGIGERILPAVTERLGLTDVEDAKDLRLRRKFRTTPLEALDALAATSEERGRSVMSYKIFPKQLSMDVMGEILDNERRHPIFLVRRRLDVYISREKARHSDSWTQRSTADVRPELDVDDFLQWAAEIDQWYADVFKVAQEREKKILIVGYESDIDVPKPQLVKRIHKALRTFGIRTTLKDAGKTVRFKRQDVRGEPFEKISNGEAVRTQLQEAGKLKYALASPLEEERLAHPFLRG